MLTANQLEDLEKTLWATTGSPEAYKLLRDNLDVRLALNTLMRDVYAVLSEQHDNMHETAKLVRLEENLSKLEDVLK